MYQKVMVPLDGSELAECVLSHVETIVEGCQAKNVVFVRAVEPLHLHGGLESRFPPEERQRLDEAGMNYAGKYLDDLISKLKYKGVNMQSEVLFGHAAASLTDYAEKNDFDLIIIATHGRSGVSRWVWGSVADRILRSSQVPVLMVRAPGCTVGI